MEYNLGSYEFLSVKNIVEESNFKDEKITIYYEEKFDKYIQHFLTFNNKIKDNLTLFPIDKIYKFEELFKIIKDTSEINILNEMFNCDHENEICILMETQLSHVQKSDSNLNIFYDIFDFMYFIIRTIKII